MLLNNKICEQDRDVGLKMQARGERDKILSTEKIRQKKKKRIFTENSIFSLPSEIEITEAANSTEERPF